MLQARTDRLEDYGVGDRAGIRLKPYPVNASVWRPQRPSTTRALKHVFSPWLSRRAQLAPEALNREYVCGVTLRHGIGKKRFQFRLKNGKTRGIN